MLELLVGFALNVAQDALKNILSDLIVNRQKRRLSDQEIERVVAETVRQQTQLASNIQDQVHELALVEIHKIIDTHPALVRNRHKIGLAADTEDHARKLELHQQIEGLQQIIDDRRRELGLPLTEAEAEIRLGSSSPPTELEEVSKEPSVGETTAKLPAMRQAQPPELPSYWRQRAEQTRRHLSDWHADEPPSAQE